MDVLIGWLMTVLAAFGTPCQAEDGPAPCYWDAQTQGNGHGQTVLILFDR